MSKTYVPDGYESALNLYKTQEAISFIKSNFQKKLSAALNLMRVSGPLFVDSHSGLNDDLNGVERPVKFDIKAADKQAEIVHSLAKWKRYALYKYGFAPLTGIYTDMNAVRRDEELDNLHSVYVDQWDWEKIITDSTRNEEYLVMTVKQIVDVICDTAEEIKNRYGIDCGISRNVKVISTQELEDLYPDLTPKQREDEITKKFDTVFITQIGGKLRSGIRHDGRAPDYDDWKLNGDIMFYNRVLNRAFEISSMGIRVNRESLISQLTESDCLDRLSLPFHSALEKGELPLTMGGGIGQSRLCMLLLNKAHIGEVQCSVWDTETELTCKNAGIELL
ncbi:MAG: aspartate--ammonia ligase [Clostridiales bacterium]|nr:aspartate--ammonia ligase [Clostridiales bacterium]MDY4655299.1 aspartate--ammonia ligase [Eubacteriales bacterium]